MHKLATPSGLALIALVIASVFLLLNTTPSVFADDDHGDSPAEATTIYNDGRLVGGKIDPTADEPDVDYFSFSVQRGVRYSFVLDLKGVYDARIEVVNSEARGLKFSPGQVRLPGENEDQIKVQWIARTTDTYFIEISGVRSDAPDGSAYLGSYLLSSTEDKSLEDRHSDAKTNATSISIDNVYRGAISPWSNQPVIGTKHGADDRDYFSFQASRGVRYTVDLQLGTAEGVEVALIDSRGRKEESSNGAGPGLVWVAPSSGTYYVMVSGSNRVEDSVGTYSLSLNADSDYEDRHDGSQAGATIVRFGNAHQGAISPEGDRDVFSFRASRGIKYSITANLGDAQGIELAGIELAIEGTGGQHIASNSGISTTLDWVAPATKTYFIVVSGSAQVRTSVGTYSLVVDADPDFEDRHSHLRQSASRVQLGNEVSGAISPADDLDYFSFTAKRGASYSIAVAFTSDFPVDIKILAANGKTVHSNRGIGSQVNWTAQSVGRYYVAVSSAVRSTGQIATYTITVEGNDELKDRHGDTKVSATQVEFGTTYQGSISPLKDKDYFRFRATRGVRYDFQLSYDTAEAVSLAVYQYSDGPAEASNYGDGASVMWIAPDDEVYAVEVTASPAVQDPLGAYSLKIEADTALGDRHDDSPAQATPIFVGNATAAAISPADDTDYFAFDGERGEEYVVQVQLGTAPAVHLFLTQDQAGYTKSNFGQGNTLEWLAPVTGTYLVAVTGDQHIENPVGTYQITVTTRDGLVDSTTDPIPPAPADTVAPTDSETPVPPGPGLIVEPRIVAPGGKVVVPVSLVETGGLSSVGFTLHYDPAVLEVIRVSKGPRLSPATFSYNYDVAGVVRVGFAAPDGFGDGGPVVGVEFGAIGELDTTSLLNFTDVLAGDTSGAQIPLQLREGHLTIGQPTVGDGNGDGRITALDALIALKASAGLAPETPVLDLDGDGSVTTQDVRQILIKAKPE